MERLFRTSESRRLISVDGVWNFITDKGENGEKLGYPNGLPAEAAAMPVPSMWNNTLGLFHYEGTAWYETTIFTKSSSIVLTFEAVHNECEVYLDGKKIGYHYGGWNEFKIYVDGITRGEHKLVLRVNNSLNIADKLPHPYTDWFNYGGIARSVYLLNIADAHIFGQRISYELDVDKKSASVTVEAKIKTRGTVSAPFEIYFGDELIYSKQMTVDGEAEIKTKPIALGGLKLWDIYKPNLYTFTLKFGGDDISERIGFRKIEARNKAIYLNGKEITILGVNRHEEHPDFGFAMPYQLIKRDFDIIKDMNCNTVRGSHYPNSKKTLDLCDEMGLLFWEEIPMWGFRDGWFKPLTNDLFTERARLMHKEMIERDYHHPCIVMWGLHNEIANYTPEGRKMSETLSSLIRSMDNSRLITYASMDCTLDKNKQDIGFDLVDVVSLNRYIGWYGSYEREERFDAMAKRMRSYLEKTGNGDKPMLLSEFGAGGILGQNSFEAPRWSENYQAAFLDTSIKEYLGSGEVAGTLVWQFADTRSAKNNELSRPRSFNNKGLVDEYRRPKFAYETVKRVYAEYNPDSKNETKIKIY